MSLTLAVAMAVQAAVSAVRGCRPVSASPTISTPKVSTNSVNSTWVARFPIRTVSVRLPARRSWSMSRRLFASSTAQASSPAATPASHASSGTTPDCTNAVPSVATSPKKTKT